MLQLGYLPIAELKRPEHLLDESVRLTAINIAQM